MRLTDTALKALPTPPAGAKIYHDELTGFGVRVTSKGVKSFVLTYGHHRQRITLGRYPLVSLSDARTEAKRILAERTLNRHRPARMKGTEALERYYTEKETKLRASTLYASRVAIKAHFGKLLTKSLEDISAPDITDITDRLLKRGQPGAAVNCYKFFRGFLRWCVKRRYLAHSPIEGMDAPSKTAARERVLTDDELRAVWKAAVADNSTFGRVVQLLMLTGQRRTEIGSLKAEWIEADRINFPASICKNKQPHSIPIGPLTASLVQPISFRGWSHAKARLDKLACIDEWRLHDIRRSYVTNLQRLKVPLEVREALINHIGGTRAGVAGIYARYQYWDEMVEAVATYEAWFRRTIMANDGALTAELRQS